MSTEDLPVIQSLSTNDLTIVQLASTTFRPPVGLASTDTPLMAQPTPTSSPPTVQPTPANGPLTVQAQPLLANSQCQPLGPNFRFCSGDVAAIAGAVLFVCYVVWGIPATIRFYKYVRGMLAARRQRQLATSQDLERNLQGTCPSGEAASSSSTLQGRDFGQSCPPLDDKIKSALDQRRLNNFKYPTSDSRESIARSIQTIPRSPTQEFYSAPATPVPGYDASSSSQSSSPTTLPVADEEKCKDEAAVESHDSGAPPPASMDQPFGRIRALCKPYMW